MWKPWPFSVFSSLTSSATLSEVVTSFDVVTSLDAPASTDAISPDAVTSSDVVTLSDVVTSFDSVTSFDAVTSLEMTSWCVASQSDVSIPLWKEHFGLKFVVSKSSSSNFRFGMFESVLANFYSIGSSGFSWKKFNRLSYIHVQVSHDSDSPRDTLNLRFGSHKTPGFSCLAFPRDARNLWFGPPAKPEISGLIFPQDPGFSCLVPPATPEIFGLVPPATPTKSRISPRSPPSSKKIFTIKWTQKVRTLHNYFERPK